MLFGGANAACAARIAKSCPHCGSSVAQVFGLPSVTSRMNFGPGGSGLSAARICVAMPMACPVGVSHFSWFQVIEL
jgi:hypothetical protein